MHYLKLACRPDLFSLMPKNWPVVELSDQLNPAELACIVAKKQDAAACGIYQLFKEKLGLPLPFVEADLTNLLSAQIDQAAQQYEKQVIPPFLLELVNFAQRNSIIFSTPGHHNGQFFAKHPAGALLKDFYGDNFFKTDVSDSVFELGDMMTHEGGPLLAEKQAAQAFNADKAYFVTNGTTGANMICANAILNEGDLCLFDRNNHKSLYNGALVMTGAKPVYLPTDRNSYGLIGPLTAASFDEAKIRREIAKVDPAKAKAKRPFRLAVMQLETYDGVFYDARSLIKRIGQLCDYILFDCAWGGYEQFIKTLRDCSPFQMDLGPEDPGMIVTQSIHKQQAGLAQASQILKKDHHLYGQKRYVDHKHFNHTYLQYVTTSYSYPIYSSLVANAAIASSPKNEDYWQAAVKLGIKFRKRLLKKSKLFKPLVPSSFRGQQWVDVQDEILASDSAAWKLSPEDAWHGFNKIAEDECYISPLKLTILSAGIDQKTGSFAKEGVPGAIVEEYLHERGIIPEKSDIYSTLYLITPGETEAEMMALLTALLDFEKAYNTGAPLKSVVPQVCAENPIRYQNYTLKQLCQELHEFYRTHQIKTLMRDLFLKNTFQDYPITPAEADRAFSQNKSELLKLDELAGHIALEGALAYPPGVFIVAPGEKWQDLDVEYFKLLLEAAEQFPGFEPEVQGIYAQTEQGKLHYYSEVLKK